MRPPHPEPEAQGFAWTGEDPFSPEALQRALQGEGEDLDFDSEILEHEELHAVARRIAGSHVDVVASFARTVFSGTVSRADMMRFTSALSQLERLALAADDGVQEEVLRGMREFVVDRLAALEGKRGRRVLLPRVRGFLDAFSACLDGEDAERLARLVRYEAGTVPLLEQLARLSGIGPRRLERLYCCGLYSVDALVHADPDEVAAVSGLPRLLAGEVVRAARAWASERRDASVRQLRTSLAEFLAMAEALREPIPVELVRELELARAESDAALHHILGGVS